MVWLDGGLLKIFAGSAAGEHKQGMRPGPLAGQDICLKPPAGLQLQMNRWSDARRLKDDASMIVVELETPTRGE